MIILIPGQSAVWRYDQIAAIEIYDDTTLSIFPVGSRGRDNTVDYEYSDEDQCKEAFAQVLKDWKAACETP